MGKGRGGRRRGRREGDKGCPGFKSRKGGNPSTGQYRHFDSSMWVFFNGIRFDWLTVAPSTSFVPDSFRNNYKSTSKQLHVVKCKHHSAHSEEPSCKIK